MVNEYVHVIPKNAFDMDILKDNMTNLQCKHDEIVDIAKNCTDKYYEYIEGQKELLKQKLPGLVFGVCKHLHIGWDKTRHVEDTGFWTCSDCNEIMTRNYWITETNKGWVTRKENEIIDKILIAFFAEYPDVGTDICCHDRMGGI